LSHGVYKLESDVRLIDAYEAHETFKYEGICTKNMGINERDLYTYMIVSGLWLKDKQPPVVRRAQEIAKECGIYTSSPLFLRALERLVDAKWLAPVEYGKGMHRYVPTPRGFAYIPLLFNRHTTDPISNCLSKHVDVSSIVKLGNIINDMIVLSQLLSTLGLPLIGVTPEMQAQLMGLLQAMRENRPIDPQTAEQLLRMEPLLECNFEYYLYHYALLIAKYRELEHACKSGTVSELETIVRGGVEMLIKIARHCASKGILIFGDVAKEYEKLLQSSTPLVQCGNT